MTVGSGDESGAVYPPQWAAPHGPGQYVPPYAPVPWQGGVPQPWTTPSAPPKVSTGLATASVVSCSVVTLVCAWSFVASFGVVDAIRQWGYETYDETMLPYDWVTVLFLVVQLVSGVITIAWLWRARVFAETYAPLEPHARGRVWVVLGWFVPIVSWWFPYQVVRDVGRAILRREPPRLGMWWAAWLVGELASNAAGRVLSESTYQALPVFEGAATLGLALALVWWISIVRAYTAGQQETARTGASPATGTYGALSS